MQSDETMIVHTCEQGSPEWHEARAGCITASMFTVARDKLKTGARAGDWKEAGHNYAFNLAVERIAGHPVIDTFETWQMRRGKELEPDAREIHELRYDLQVERAGFVTTPDGKFGCSADGFIHPDGGAEYKCFIAPEKLRPLLFDLDPSVVADQVQGCMAICGKAWWHMGLYCPDLVAADREFTLIPMDRDDDYIESLWRDLWAFDRLVESYVARLRDKAA